MVYTRKLTERECYLLQKALDGVKTVSTLTDICVRESDISRYYYLDFKYTVNYEPKLNFCVSILTFEGSFFDTMNLTFFSGTAQLITFDDLAGVTNGLSEIIKGEIAILVEYSVF